MLKAIRVATTIETDTEEEVRLHTTELFSQMLKENNIKEEDILSIYFTVTNDIKSFNPAAAVRHELGFTQVAMLCGQEAFVTNGLKLCIRALIHVNLPAEIDRPKHIYLNKANVLRKDWITKN